MVLNMAARGKGGRWAALLPAIRGPRRLDAAVRYIRGRGEARLLCAFRLGRRHCRVWEGAERDNEGECQSTLDIFGLGRVADTSVGGRPSTKVSDTSIRAEDGLRKISMS